jgi:hypothetical protein
MAIAIIDDPQAFETFSKTIATPPSRDGNANTAVVNTNR